MDHEVMLLAPGSRGEARQIIQGPGSDSGGTSKRAPGFHFVPAEPGVCGVECIHLVVQCGGPVFHLGTGDVGGGGLGIGVAVSLLQVSWET